MDGRNSSGRTISLLNDCWAGNKAIPTTSHDSSSKRPQLPPLFAGIRAHSPASSCASTPSLTHQGSTSPQTPHLVRSESSDSRAFASPSPLTPHFTSFDSAAALHFKPAPTRSSSFYSSRRPPLLSTASARMDEAASSMYPSMIPESANVMSYPISTAQSLPALQQTSFAQAQSQQPQSPTLALHQDESPASDSRISNNSNGSNGKSAPKKNQYPCPMAKQFNCTDYFTTSGHAARHAKKHTGKKDAFCPECNKAFTRKDNMEQHRRTHQNVRGPSSKTAGDNRVKKSTKPTSRKSDKPATADLEAAVSQLADEQVDIQQDAVSQYQVSQPRNTHMPLMPAGSGPYFVNANADPIAALPQPMPTEFLTGRPSLMRTGFSQSLDYLPQSTPLIPDATDLHYNYPSPGLSNGLNTLALAASDHGRMSEEDSN